MGCASSEILTLGAVRTYIQVPDPRSCGRKSLYYGTDCQLMEVDGVQRNIRNAGTPLRTWNRRTRSYCEIANTETPPDNPQVTLRFYEQCGRGLPLPHVLGECRIRVVNNYGLCKSNGSIATGWSSYSEVLDVRILSENRGRRSSYDGADDALVDEITAELLNIFDVSTVQFSKVDLSNMACLVGGGGVFNDATFGCYVGCGGRTCECTEPCDDGTYTFYIPSSCTGGTTQFLIHTSDGGEDVESSILPASSGGGVATTHPKVAVIGNTLYMLAYQNPPELFKISLDEKGKPEGNWQSVAVLTGTDAANNPVTTGIPADLVVDGDFLHILVEDAANGSRFYTLGGTRNPAIDGERFTFPAASRVTKLDACSGVVVAGGIGGSLFLSEDDGASFGSIVTDLNLPADPITAVKYVDGKIWVGSNTGYIGYTANNGDDWTEVNVSGMTGTINDLNFVGDDIGWTADASGGVFSTWIGGLNADEWTDNDQRVYGLPDDFTPTKVVLPQCASAVLAANTVLLLGTNAANESVAYIGRASTTGGG